MPGGASKAGGGEVGPSAGAGSGGGTSCDQADATDIQTISEKRKEIRIFMECGLNQISPHRERPISWALGVRSASQLLRALPKGKKGQ